MTPIVRTATPGDLDGVIDVLAECSAWLRTKGIVQWPDRFPRARILPAQEAGDLYVVADGSLLVATVTLGWSDPMFWGDRDDAGFIHRLGVRRSHAGLGSGILTWASTEAVARGRRYLCLDCLSTNRRLRRYYEDHGYSVVGESAGPIDHDHTIAHGPWTALLYERPLDPT
jgi:GNAT superfamily N-acetyltransferase